MSRLTHKGWQIEPDYSAPFVGHTWTAHSVDHETSVAAATYEELLDEIEGVEAEYPCAVPAPAWDEALVWDDRIARLDVTERPALSLVSKGGEA
jgi:hypothetical protein